VYVPASPKADPVGNNPFVVLRPCPACPTYSSIHIQHGEHKARAQAGDASYRLHTSIPTIISTNNISEYYHDTTEFLIRIVISSSENEYHFRILHLNTALIMNRYLSSVRIYIYQLIEIVRTFKYRHRKVCKAALQQVAAAAVSTRSSECIRTSS
jgi:hypothetical protein